MLSDQGRQELAGFLVARNGLGVLSDGLVQVAEPVETLSQLLLILGNKRMVMAQSLTQLR